MRLPVPFPALRLLLAAVLAWSMAAGMAQAATATYSVLLDTDSNAATGCTVAGPGGPIAGIEQVATTVVDTTSSGATVTRLERQVCGGGVLGAASAYDPGGWPVGFGNGTGGAAVIESSIPLGVLPPGASMRAVALSSGGGQDVTTPFAINLVSVGAPGAGVVPVPLSPWLVLPLAAGILLVALWMRRRYPHHTFLAAFLVVFALSGLAWAATVIRDGSVGDWSGVPPAVTDAKGDAPPNADIVAVFYQQDPANLYLRYDSDLRKDVVNQAPVVGAGANQTITLPAMASLQGSASDDGLPNPPGAITLAWSKVSGPGTVAFGNASSAVTTASFSLAGTYLLRLTANDGALSTSADVTVVVNDVAPPGANQPPVVSAGAAQSITLPSSVSLSGTATDDGKPTPPGTLLVTWSLAAGPGLVMFFNSNALVTQAAFSAPGTYTLRLTAFDGELSASATTQVTVADGGPQIAPIADRTIVAGTRLQVVVQASDAAGDVLSYAMPAAPSGATLNPAPLIDWVPSAAQVGTHAFTVQVADTNGHTASESFNVTVTAPANTPPQLGAQENQVVAIGTTFTRKLSATDPDAGEALTFSLQSGPAGMTLSGADLSWPTTGRSAGDYGVTVRVADKAGAFDQKSFTVTLQAVATPVAVDDEYTVKPGATLSVPAPGVLGNDLDPSGNGMTATRLTDPTKGTLSAFNADGSFTFVAPSSLPPAISLKANALSGSFVNDSTGYSFSADLNKDGAADVVTTSFGVPVAADGKTGARLWTGWDASPTSPGQNCGQYLFATDFALGDVDASGGITLITGTHCDAKYTAGVSNRLIAIDTDPAHAVAGAAAVKWVSERLDVQVLLPPSVGAPPVPTYLINSQEAGLTSFATPTLARLTPGGGVKVLTRILIQDNTFPYDSDGDGTRDKYASCYAATGNIADQGRGCQVTFVVNAATGVKELVLTAPNPYNQAQTYEWQPMRQTAPVVADLDGDGQVEIVSGTDVWKYDGTKWSLAWQATLPGITTFYEPLSVSVADVDGDGKAEVILQAEWADSVAFHRGFLTYRHDGVLLHKFELPTWDVGLPSIADVDGDGTSEILFAARGIVYAYGPDGRLVWASQFPDDDLASNPDDDPTVRHWPAAVDARTGPSTGLQVYDLDLDGRPEIIVVGSYRVAIFDGRTGLLRSSVHSNAAVRNKVVPLIVDANGDGHADIFAASGNSGVCTGCPPVHTMVFSGVGRDWAPAPRIQNQISYNPWAIDDAGAISYDGGIHRSFRTQRQLGTVVDPRTRDTATFTYADAGGGGTSAPATVRVQVVPQNSPPVITSTPPTSLYAVAGPGGVYPTFLYQVAATDPDVGDTVRYELVYSTINTGYFPQATVDPVTGVMRMYSGPCGSYGGPCDFGPLVFIVAAVDSFGARTEQGFVVDVTYISANVPDVVGQLVDAAKTAVSNAKLTPRVTEVFSAQPVGTVVAQDPAAGTVVGRSATVLLSVSKGPQPVTMPFVVGQQIGSAYATLAGLGLSVNVTSAFSTTIPAGEVMTQSPAFGTLLIPATAPPADLTVSAGGPLPAPIARIDLLPGNATRLATESIPYRAVATLTDGTGADVTLKATWSSSVTGVASITPAGIAKALAAGTTNIRATVGSAQGNATLTVVARVNGDTTPPAVQITAPADGASVKKPVSVTGSATDANFLRYELAFAAADSDAWIVIGQGTSPVSTGALGAFDPTMLENDLYTLRLTAYDRAGNSAIAEVTVQVEGNRKVGTFSLAYTDLNLPSPGVPVTVTRTYDSRVKSQGDFGIGWRLGVQTLQLRTNRILGTGWERTVSGPTVTLSPLSEHRISLTLSDGTVEQFDLVLSPTSNLGSLDFTRVTGIAPRVGTLGRMEYLGNPDLLIIDDGARTVLVDDTTLDVFDPRLFRYTTIDGLVMEIDRIDGVKKVVDRNGNTVSYGPAGIVHSNGRSILFNRDAKGRVVQILDPDGRAFSYGYDENGDLVRVVDPLGATSRYKYDSRHNLIEIVDPSGRGGIRSEYDDSGRLVAVIDAAGKRVEFTHDLAARRETITDRRGNVSTVEYDDDGNPTRQQAAVTIDGTLATSVVTMSYDARGNVTAHADADGRRRTSTFDRVLPLTETADPGGLGLTTTYTYNGASDPTRLVDPAGRSFDFVYDGSGNLTSATNPLTGSSTASFDGRGLVNERIDALGNHTRLTRDGAGNLIREEVYEGSSSLLRRVEHTYDTSGRRTRTTLYRTVGGSLTAAATDYTHDAMGRLAGVRDPLGATTSFEYDAAGRKTASVDAQGRRTAYAYDLLGRLASTTYPDGTSETRAYDANGNLLQSTDRAGRTTTHAYDELNRKVAVTLPGGATSRSILSPAGLVTATIDTRGQRTDYTYDSVGRLVEWRLPEVLDATTGTPVRPRFTRTLNALGAPLTTTDPRGGVTSFQYDATGRLVRVTYPDGAQATRSYDAVGRLLQEVNEEGEATQYAYDALGRLVSVSGARGQATYAYDEAGALVAQTDALGRTTRYVYDAAGRLVERRTPAGRSERYAHSASGELIARTDPAGRITTYSSDAMGRVVQVAAPGMAPIAFTYAADGQRASVTDARGTTTYTYDAAGRLASVRVPGGDTVSYTYDAAGNIVTMATPSASVAYAHDAAGRPLDVTAPEGVTHYGYDAAGNLVRRTAANGVRSDVVFDVRGRPTDLSHRDSGGALLASFTNIWSPSGRRTRTVENGGAAEDYGYDAMGRLVSHVRTGVGAFTDAFAYDAAGNRTQRVRDGVTTAYSYDVDDRLVTAGASTFAWDVNGNLVSVAGPGGSVQYGYDAFDRMASVTGPGGVTQYEYDADGAQVGIGTAGANVRRLVAHRNPTGLSQVLEERDGAGSLIARYTMGRDVLAQTRGGATSVYLRDALGSVRALAGTAGTVTDSYRYDAWGATAASTGTTANPLRFAGERLDDASGFYNLRARHLDPANGRFTSRDTFDGHTNRPTSLNRYAYADADPVNRVDPLGYMSLPELTVWQSLQAIIDRAELINKAATACRAYSKIGAARTLITMGVLVPSAIATLQSLDLGSAFGGQTGFTGGAETTLLSLDPSHGGSTHLSRGEIRKFELKLVGAGGKAGVKGTMEFEGWPTGEAQVAGPPLEILVNGGFPPHKFDLAKITECGVPVGEIFLETTFKVQGAWVSGTGQGTGFAAGFAASSDLKADIFLGAIQVGVPLVAAEVGSSGSKASILGVSINWGWLGIHSL